LNSLLAEHLDFDVGSKLPEKITKETTNKLEAMIKQRILDGLFDDPVKKSLEQRHQVSAEELLQFEKSKKGLGEIYEEDFKSNVLGQTSNPEVDA
jgi:U3 small nucleolar RNA-associated protein MPP10